MLHNSYNISSLATAPCWFEGLVKVIGASVIIFSFRRPENWLVKALILPQFQQNNNRPPDKATESHHHITCSGSSWLHISVAVLTGLLEAIMYTPLYTYPSGAVRFLTSSVNLSAYCWLESMAPIVITLLSLVCVRTMGSIWVIRNKLARVKCNDGGLYCIVWKQKKGQGNITNLLQLYTSIMNYVTLTLICYTC